MLITAENLMNENKRTYFTEKIRVLPAKKTYLVRVVQEFYDNLMGHFLNISVKMLSLEFDVTFK